MSSKIYAVKYALFYKNNFIVTPGPVLKSWVRVHFLGRERAPVLFEKVLNKRIAQVRLLFDFFGM